MDRKTYFYLFVIILLFSTCVNRRYVSETGSSDNLFSNKEITVGEQDRGKYIVSTSQIVDPVGSSITFPGSSVDVASSPDDNLLAIKNSSGVVIIDRKTRKILQTLKYPRGGSSFYGIEWISNQKIWVTDNRGYLRSAVMDKNGEFTWKEAINLPGFDKESSYPGGIAINNETLYVTLNRNNSIGIIDLKTNTLIEQIPVGVAPYAISIKNNKAYVTNWGGRVPKAVDFTHKSSGSPVVIDDKTGVASSGTVSVISLDKNTVIKEINVYLHPCAMAFSPDSSLLYVANSNSDLISVINTKSDEVIETISCKPVPKLPFGSTPNDIITSPDGKTLYVANGGDNLICVIDLVNKNIKGLIPTGWYPSGIEISKDGRVLSVVNMKGVGSRQKGVREHGFNTHDRTSSVTFVPVPNSAALDSYTKKASENMNLPEVYQRIASTGQGIKMVPIPTEPNEKSVFKHVVYIIKENRTYDQVFGDIQKGNGDSTLCMFGEYITPNHHKLADEFVLLDNTYCNGVLSAEGHQWTSQGYVTDYLERAFPNFIRSYPWNGDDPLVYSPKGFIWDYVLNAGLSFRTYGEFVRDSIIPGDATWTDIYEDYLSKQNRIKILAIPTIHTLRGNYCPTYTGSPRTINDQYKADQFIKELNDFEKTNAFPNLMMLSLPNNHTSGTQEGFPTPSAMVADNDLALGRIVEAISKSKFWSETVIFVIEDDPQNGLDHVDGHRTVAFCISPYTKRQKVVSTHYNQNSILRSIQLIFGLPPMTQFDLFALPMNDCFTDVPDFTAYEHLPNNVPLDEMNPRLADISGEQLNWAKKSMALNLSLNDDLNVEEEITLNKVLWHSVKGYDRPYPELNK
jgi:YVTN family beta-propeller protein